MFSCQLRTLLSVLQYILPFFIGHQSPCYALYITHALQMNKKLQYCFQRLLHRDLLFARSELYASQTSAMHHPHKVGSEAPTRARGQLGANESTTLIFQYCVQSDLSPISPQSWPLKTLGDLMFKVTNLEQNGSEPWALNQVPVVPYCILLSYCTLFC